MIIKIFNKRYGSPYSKPKNIEFAINWKELRICIFPYFCFWFHKKEKNNDSSMQNGIFQFIIGYKLNLYNKKNKGLIYINSAYCSKKRLFGFIPIQRFLNKDYSEK